MKNEAEKLKSGLSQLGISITDEQLQQLVRFFELLIEKNKVMNLTAITEWDDVVLKHYIDSASISDIVLSGGNRVYDILHKGVKVCDLGTGAGFPGIPLAILFPKSSFTLMDALRKRIDFLREAAEEIGLSNVSFFHGRAEELARDDKHREGFDLCVSRAVSSLNVLCEYCLPFVKVGGTFLSYKGEKGMDECESARRATEILGGGNPILHDLVLPGSDLSRLIVEIPKITSTDNSYPRRAGTPEKKPL